VDLCDAQVTPCQSQVGGGSVPGSTLESYGLKITGGHADRLAKLLRAGSPAVQTRVTDDCVLLDLRTVAESELKPLSARLCDALQRLGDEDLGA
jgi:L-seryl-tRNA(Ser) seleniumtransferase